MQNVNKNVELVPISLPNMKYVPMKPEYQLNFAHVPMDIVMTIPNVKNAPNSVKLVQLPPDYCAVCAEGYDDPPTCE